MRRILIVLALLVYIGQLSAQEEVKKDTVYADDSVDVEYSAMPVITISASDLESDQESQDISGLLSASRDPFVSTAGYTFGPARYRIRGYDSENTLVTINGLIANDVESGRAYWSTWGGLNDATRNKVVESGITANQVNYGGIGGATNIITRASSYRKGVKATYSLTNRSYRNRLMLIASTGMMENGVAVTFSGSRRWSQEGYVQGTFYDAWSYFFSAEKKISEAHSLSFTIFGAPTVRGKQSVATQEAYDLTDNHYYNSYWGYQDGEKRNSRVSNYHKPMMMLNHFWKIDEKSKLTTGYGYSFGRGGSTALNWYNAQDPRPDYYRYLPSYYDTKDPDEYNRLYNLWTTNDDYGQLNWDFLYFANSDEYDRIENADGQDGNTVEGIRSKYIIEERRNDHSRSTINSQYDRDVNEHIKVSAGVNVDLYKGYHFKEMSDLLGGDFWLDVDQFAERDLPEWEDAQSDLNHTNNIIEVGDRFGYDYTANVNTYSLYGQSEFTYSKVDGYLGANATYTEFWRTGNMKNGKFPDESYGDSEKQQFINYGVKGGATYKITGRHIITANGTFLTRAPNFRNSYLSARTRDHVVEGLTSETIYSGDVSYHFRSPYIKGRLTYYYTEFKDGVSVRSFYHDDLRTFVNYSMTGIDKLHTGMELGLEAKVSPTITLTGMAGTGEFIYNSRPEVTIVADNNSEVLVDSKTVYIKNFRMSGPQTVGSFGAKYFSPKYWSVGASINYIDNVYININPERRTDDALNRLYVEDPQPDMLFEQQRFHDYYTIDLFGYKSWKIKDYYINVSVNVNNLLNRTDIITGGFEQYRYNAKDLNKFPNKYFYMYGRTYFVNLSFRF